MDICEIQVSYKKPTIVFEKVNNSKMAYEIFMSTWNQKIINLQEEFKIIFLDRNNSVLGIFNQSKGGVAGTLVDPKITFGVALKAKASALILAHNHPSGEKRPSMEDKQLTKKLVQGAKLLDISIIDHLIITNDGYFSFADNGLM